MGAAEEPNRQEQSEQAKPQKRFSSTHTSVRGISLLNLVSDKGVFFPGQTDESPSLGIATGLPAATLRVPQDFPTVQGAVAASISGDAIVISPGLYVIPASPCTFANGSQSTCGIVLHDGTALIGLGPAQTMLDFSGAQVGILLQNGTATVKLLHLRNASTDIFAYVGSNITANNIIITNSNLGIELNQGNSYTIINATIDGIHDPTQTGTGIDVPFGGVVNLQNNLVTNSDRGFASGSFSFGTYAFNDVFGSGSFDWGECGAAGYNAVTAPANNISSDPLYCPDFTLQPGSPGQSSNLESGRYTF